MRTNTITLDGKEQMLKDREFICADGLYELCDVFVEKASINLVRGIAVLIKESHILNALNNSGAKELKIEINNKNSEAILTLADKNLSTVEKADYLDFLVKTLHYAGLEEGDIVINEKNQSLSLKNLDKVPDLQESLVIAAGKKDKTRSK